MFEVNLWAVIIAAVAANLVGFAWYSNWLFGRPWRRAMGLSEEHMAEQKAKKNMAGIFAFSAVADLITAYVVANLLNLFLVFSLNDASQLAIWLWLGLMMPIMVGGLLWENKSWKLLAINGSYRLAALLIMTLILAFFQS